MKCNQGITLIALIITIIVMIILAAATIRVATNSLDSTVTARIINEKRELENAIIQRFANYSSNENAFPLLGNKATTSELAEVVGINEDNIEYIRKVDKSDIQSLGVKNTTGKSYFVDYFAGEVFGPVE